MGVGPALGREQDCCKGGTDVTGAERIPDSGLHWGLTQLTDFRVLNGSETLVWADFVGRE